jgi:hypothetical protein
MSTNDVPGANPDNVCADGMLAFIRQSVEPDI